MNIRNAIKKADYFLIGSAILLVVLSLILLATGSDRTNPGYLYRQAISVAVGIIAMVVVARTHYSLFRQAAMSLYFILLFMLLFVLQGKIIRGASSWLDLGAFGVQPSELAKVILTLVLARIVVARKNGAADWRVLFSALVYAGIPIAMVLIQPDFGTGSLLMAIAFGTLIVSRLNIKAFLAITLISVLLASAGWMYFLKDYQKKRVYVFLNPGSDPLGSGYTVLQATTAFGSGGFWGKGLGYGPQSRLNFLPENRTDFIFARIGEELGLVGAGSVLIIYSIILTRMILASFRAADPFGALLAAGASVTLFSGILVNTGMNLGLLPVTGVPLPFISYGGSNLVSMFILLGLVESVVIHNEKWEKEDTSEVVNFQGIG